MKIQNRRRGFTLIELAVVILIIGVVVAAILAADVLVSKARIASAENLTKSAPLTEMKDVMFWFETTLTSSVDNKEESDGAAVSSWYDLSSSKSDATAGDSSPTYANTINRIHATKFTGGQYFNVNASALNGSDYSFVIVDKRLSNKSDNYFIGDPTSNTLNQSLLLGYSLNGKAIHSQGGVNSYTANVESYESSTGAPRVFVFISSAAGKKMYINGALMSSSVDTTKLSNIGTLVIGKAYEGEIGEIAAMNRALTDLERQDVTDYLMKKYSVKTFTGSCINGTMTSGGCTYNTCPVTVDGSSITTVNTGSGTLDCNSTGYTGTVSYTCAAGVANVTGTCSCASGYTLVSGVCAAQCAVSGVTGVPNSTVNSGSGTLNCSATGYTGTISYDCTAGVLTPGSSCSCASGYSMISGTCQASTSCAVSGVSGVSNTTVSSASGTLNCSQTGFTGTASYTCSAGTLTITSACACADGYEPSGTGGCLDVNAGYCYINVKGSSTVAAPVGTTTVACDKAGFTGSVTFSNCTYDGASVSKTCNCLSGYVYYPLSGGTCTYAPSSSCSWSLAIDLGGVPSPGYARSPGGGASVKTCTNAINGQLFAVYANPAGTTNVTILNALASTNTPITCYCSGTGCSPACSGAGYSGGKIYRCDCP